MSDLLLISTNACQNILRVVIVRRKIMHGSVYTMRPVYAKRMRAEESAISKQPQVVGRYGFDCAIIFASDACREFTDGVCE